MTAAGHSRRLAKGGMIDRSRPLAFAFNGRTLSGYEGDTLASALMANGVDVVARSLKYHRPRGIMTDGPEEPNAVVTVGEGSSRTPNLKATEVILHDGLVTRSQNCWPSVNHDVGAVAGLAAPLLGAGFYYKTFMAPRGAWPGLYERLIRRAAGLGRAPEGHDPDLYEHRHFHCDVLIVGAGPAGLAAARVLAQAGLRLLLCDERSRPGGSLTGTMQRIDGEPASAWARQTAADIAASPRALVLLETCAVWLGDHQLVALVERRPGESGVAERLWLVRPRHVVLATGAIERPLCFPGNDRPGIMLASATAAYIHRYGVAPGKRAVIHTNNDSGYGALQHLRQAEIDVRAIIDTRPRELIDEAALRVVRDVDLLPGHRIVSTAGRHRLSRIRVGPADGSRQARVIDADLLCVAGGWSPTRHLLGHRGGTVRRDESKHASSAAAPGDDVAITGVAAWVTGLAACLADGARVAGAVLKALGRKVPAPRMPVPDDETGTLSGEPNGPSCPTLDARQQRKAFVDLQNDVTAHDVMRALDEGYGAIEHLKRYTTSGMGTDQGKLGNVMAIDMVAEATGMPVEKIGHTTFRPPYTPVTLGALVGHARGERLFPTRETPFHHRHLARGALMELAGPWHYPKCYPRDGESVDAAIEREVRTVRSAVGFVDMSTLGKFEVVGPDSGIFLERAYANRLSTLAEGRCRYALMLREDGVVRDDGTVARMAKDRWHVTASTAHADDVWRHLERLRQVEWPELDVLLVDVGEQRAGLAIAGPRARDVLAAVLPDFDVSPEALPFLGCREIGFDGGRARVFRISYSGELGFEVYVGARHADRLWDAVSEAGTPFGIAPYGVEALDVMRIEKGHCAGSEFDGRTTAAELGLGRMIKRDVPFLGHALACQHSIRQRLVGLVSADRRTPIPRGAILVAGMARSRALGHVTAAVVSPTLGHPIALAMLQGSVSPGDGELRAVSPVAGLDVAVEIGDLPFYDADGARMRA
ncbi:MAG: 2Fe-2S iron-sulfur cluster-binding protein [bacterium]|nr:2Fe-2S iron-sulfur cluster-binding protein [bacterium]